jgi:Holliday junction resolvase RusA-like endonuclease
MTDTAHLFYLQRVAQALLVGDTVPRLPERPSFHMEVLGFVQPKERARGINHYTPAETRKFEAKVKDAAMKRMAELRLFRFNCPVAVHLQIYDKIPPDMPEWKIKLARAGLYFEHTGGDLDNKEKAVLDALNKVVYRDDRLVVQHYKFRRFDKAAGFKINVSACGLTKHDIENIEKHLKHGQANAKEETTRRVTG